jgi:hypothetical protein
VSQHTLGATSRSGRTRPVTDSRRTRSDLKNSAGRAKPAVRPRHNHATVADHPDISEPQIDRVSPYLWLYKISDRPPKTHRLKSV